MATIGPKPYSAAVAALVDPQRLSDLGPGAPNQVARPALESLNIDNFLDGPKIVDRDMVACCLSGLWLLHDYLDESHAISQRVQTTTGSYWHGIMHRRESDYWNSKYWFRKVGQHPIFDELHAAARRLAEEDSATSRVGALDGQTSWDPYGFVDLCEQLANRPDDPDFALCQGIARVEWTLLFDFCLRQAVGG